MTSWGEEGLGSCWDWIPECLLTVVGTCDGFGCREEYFQPSAVKG